MTQTIRIIGIGINAFGAIFAGNYSAAIGAHANEDVSTAEYTIAIGDNSIVQGKCNIGLGNGVTLLGDWQHTLAFNDRPPMELYEIAPDLRDEMMKAIDSATLTNDERSQAKVAIDQLIPVWNEHCARPRSS